MNELFDKFFKLLVLMVAACIAIRLAYDAVRPAIPLLSVLIVVAAVVWVISWYRNRW